MFDIISIQELFETDKKIICFGAGADSRKVLNDKVVFEICYFVDNDYSKWGSNGVYNTYSPKKLFSEDRNNTIVIITSSAYSEEITQQIRKNGFYHYLTYSDEVRYQLMQKNYYNKSSILPERYVASEDRYVFHENFPYETLLLYVNGDIRKPIFDNFESKRAFDIGCGEGRMVRRMKKIFGEVDGADISKKMINAAIERTPGSKFYITDGNNCGNAENDYYDFVYCTISMQHICSFTVRDKITSDAIRLLKKSGKLTYQMTYSSNGLYQLISEKANEEHKTRFYQKNNVHATFFQDKFEADGTNGLCDVMITPNELYAIKNYFNNYFEEISFWFWDTSAGVFDSESAVLDKYHPNRNGIISTHYIFIHCANPKK